MRQHFVIDTGFPAWVACDHASSAVFTHLRSALT